MSPLHPPTLPEPHHRAMSLSPAPLWPPGHLGRPGPYTKYTTGIHFQRGSRGHLCSTCPSPATTLLQHIPTFYLKSKATHGLPDPLFLWKTLPYTLFQMMNTVYCVCFKVLFNCSLLPVLVTHLPHACFHFRVLGGNDEHMNFFLTLAILFSK